MYMCYAIKEYFGFKEVLSEWLLLRGGQGKREGGEEGAGGGRRGEGGGGRGGGRREKRGREGEVRGREGGEAYPPVHPLIVDFDFAPRSVIFQLYSDRP